MPSLEVHQLDAEEIYRDIVRVNKQDRKDVRGRLIPEGTIATIEADCGVRGRVILRGNDEDGTGYIRMDEATRARIRVERDKRYLFQFRKCTWAGQICWAWSATEIAYRIAMRLAILGLILGIIGAGFGIAGLVGRRTSRGYPTRPVGSLRPLLTVDEVLSWRNTYADLLGKTSDAVRERYGAPNPSEHSDWMTYTGSDKTDSRGVSFALKDGKVFVVKVFRRANDLLDPMETIKKAPLFDFGSGTFTDTTKNYFKATTKDHRSELQFSVSDQGTSFEAAIFTRGEP